MLLRSTICDLHQAAQAISQRLRLSIPSSLQRCIAKMLAVRLPNGGCLDPDGSGRIVLGRANLATAALGPAGVGAISRQQAELLLEEGSPGVARLRSLGCNAIVLEEPAGAGEWATRDVLEQGESTLVTAGMRFYIASLQEGTTCTLETCSSEAAADPTAAGPSASESQQQPAQGLPMDLTNSDTDDMHEGGQPAAKRRRREPPPPAAASLDDDSPFQLFRVKGIPDAYNTGSMNASLSDLVVGDMKLAVVESYMIDLPWLLSFCPDLKKAQKVFFIHGEKNGDQGFRDDMSRCGWAPPQGLVMHRPYTQNYGVHHTKAFVLQYGTGVRVIIHTANLLYGDCHHKTQALWTQDFPLKGPTSPASSPFEKDLADYFTAVRLPAAAARELQALIAGHDFSSARVHLVASVPGYHAGAKLHSYGHMRIRSLLSTEPMDPMFSAAPTIAQCSSIGSLNQKWLLGEFLGSLTAGSYPAAAQSTPGSSAGKAKGKGPASPGPGQSLVSSWAKAKGGAAAAAAAAAAGGGTQGQASSGTAAVRPAQPGSTEGVALNFVWPTAEEVRHSIEGWAAGGSIPGSEANVQKVQEVAAAGEQLRFCRWGGEPVGRQRAMPHYKSYTRFAGQRLPWHLVGSHNVSRAAFGTLQKSNSQLHILHFELSVLSVPSTEAAYRAHPHKGFSCTNTATAEPAAAPVGQDASTSAHAEEAAPASTTSAAPSTQQQQQQASSLHVQFWSTQGRPPADAGSDIIHVRLPVPYLLPPQQYQNGVDEPWMTGVFHQGLDMLGRYHGKQYTLYGYLDDAHPGEPGACPVQ